MLAFLCGLFLLASAPGEGGTITEEVRFEANDLMLAGLLDVPEDGEAKGLVIIVHGYGPTNVIERNGYQGLRRAFAETGFAAFVWDKPGRGPSEGTFDAQQPVASSAREVLAAAKMLRDRDVPGAHNIGLWGISRAGWIVPLAMAEDEDLAFWMSVSGPNALESFGYLLTSNWRIMGYDEERIERLYEAWKDTTLIPARGGSYREFRRATAELYEDPFYQTMTGGRAQPDRARYRTYVKEMRADPPLIDEETGLRIYVEDFGEVLSGIDAPVLALFGEKDTAVDWRAAKALYEETIGTNPDASLRIVTFPDGNHNLNVAKTGGHAEMSEIRKDPRLVEGYRDAMTEWLAEIAARP